MGKPRVIIFAAPKDSVKKELDIFLDNLKRKNWEVLQVVQLGSKPDRSLAGIADFAITLGGDGTILYASRELSDIDVPIIGINFGKIGLLTEVSLEKFYKNMGRLERGSYSILCLRRLVAYNLSSRREYPSVLNEYAIITKSPGKILGLDIYVDGVSIAKILCDGLVLSTSIGSSSYPLSTGGPVVLETMEAIVVVSIAPLFKAMCPIVLPADTVIKIEIRKEWMDALLIADGVVVGELKKGESVEIKYSKNHCTKMIRLCGKFARLQRIMDMISIKSKWSK